MAQDRHWRPASFDIERTALTRRSPHKTGKNAADIALVIDAMHMMRKGRLDGFCLVSSDSEFTRLSQRLQEDGLVVYGIGERKTLEAFCNACSRFIYLENIVETEPAEKKGATASGSAEPEGKESPCKAVKIVTRAIEDADEDGWVNLAAVGSRIMRATPDFDPRTYGCSNLSTVVTRSGRLEVRKEPGKPAFIRRKPAGRKAAGRASASG